MLALDEDARGATSMSNRLRLRRRATTVASRRRPGTAGSDGPAAAGTIAQVTTTHPDDRHWLAEAIALARRCPPSQRAYSVGAVLVEAGGAVLATGYSRENDPADHAEEAALAKVAGGDPRLPGATLFTSLEPCSRRASRPRSCTELILAAGVGRVVFAWREPALFVPDCQGVELLRTSGVPVVELGEFAAAARAVNAHLALGSGTDGGGGTDGGRPTPEGSPR